MQTRRTRSYINWPFIIGLFLIFLSSAVTVSAWLTHVIYCFKHGDWGFLIAGAILFPVAVIHGIGIWFHAW